jgi:hypothetical protein
MLFFQQIQRKAMISFFFQNIDSLNQLFLAVCTLLLSKDDALIVQFPFFVALDQHEQDHEVLILVSLEFTPKQELDFIFEYEELHSNHSKEGKLFATFHHQSSLLPFIFYSFKKCYPQNE